ncbi:retrotransposon-related protein [Tanacetum coccineum]
MLGENEEMKEEFVDAEDSLVENGSEEVQPQISINALHGVSSVSTHNFLDVNMAKKLGCSIKRTCPLSIAVPRERQLVSVSECKGFFWKLRGGTFTRDVMLLPLGGCDMVLRIQWLSTLGDIKCNFKELKMEFAELFMMYVYPNTGLSLISTEYISKECVMVPELIPLLKGVPPVNIKPYRYPPIQKDAIEAMVRELLESRVIKPSHSPFASPIVMVKKKDNSWRMCIDYRLLNKNTIKDKFHIPVINELIDELHGAVIFSKLDLRSGYHQIRMFEDDIEKTAFRTHEGHYAFLVMPFGLTNDPSTFQALMNDVFKAYLRKFTPVFFDDILIYSRSLSEHVHHLTMILQTMRTNQLFAKKTKCAFNSVIEKEFLQMVDEAQVSFLALKEAMTKAPMLALLDFAIPFKWRGYLLDIYFIIKTDHYGLKYLLDQRITTPAQIKWLPKLMGFDYEVKYKKRVENAAADALSRVQTEGHLMSAMVVSIPADFITKIKASWHTDDALQLILNQLQSGQQSKKHYSCFVGGHSGVKVTTHKLCSFVYWKGMRKEIKKFVKECITCQRSIMVSRYLLDQRIHYSLHNKMPSKLMGFVMRSSQEKSGELQLLMHIRVTNEGHLMSAMVVVVNNLRSIFESNGQLLRKNKLVVGQDEQLKLELLTYFHASSVGGHSGVKVTTHKLCSFVYWKGMRKEIKKFVKECITCQRYKPDLAAYPGLLQPLPIPNRIWESISMDFIEGLPRSKGFNVIFVVVDRLTKYAHFMPLSHPFSAMQVAQLFLDTVYKLHGLPTTIVSDRDKVFLSTFWKELFQLLQVKLLKSTAYHPQTDGQTEVVNRCLECYLRCMTGERPQEWAKWLPLAELWYNSNFHTSIHTTPFQAVYGQTPPIHVPYLGGLSKVDAVDRTLEAREQAIQMLKFHLGRSQNRMKQQAVCKGTPPVSQVSSLPSCDKDGLLAVEPIAILDRKMVKKRNAVEVYGLIQWANGTSKDATWEPLAKLCDKFPNFLSHS